MQLLASALLTAADGSFTVAAGSYSCPVASSVLYLVATGGAVGAGAASSATELMTVPGACNGIATGANFVVDELTTAGSVYALRPFLSPGAQLGATATNAGGLSLAVATAANLVNLTQGTAPGPGFPANGVAPSAKLDTVATILHGCIVSSGAGSNACTGLFAATTTGGNTPTNTLDATLGLVTSPAANVAVIFALGAGTSAFLPALNSPPADWTLAVPFTGGGMNAPASVSIDGAGDVWVVNYFGVASLFNNSGAPVYASGLSGYGLQESYGGAVDANGMMWIANEENSDRSINNGAGSVTLLNSSGPALSGNSLYAAGGLSFPIAVAFDTQNTAWVVDYGNSHITQLNSAGVPQSGTAGYTSSQFAFPVAIATDSKRNGWVANGSGSSVTEVAPDGSAFTSYTVGNGPSAVAIDAADNIWTANYYGDSVGLVSAGGAVLSGGGLTGGGLDHPDGIAADGQGTVWVANYRAPGLSKLSGAASAAPGTILSPTAGLAPDAPLLEAFGLAIDAAGNIWVSSFGNNRLVEYIGAAAPVKTPLLGGVRLP